MHMRASFAITAVSLAVMTLIGCGSSETGDVASQPTTNATPTPEDLYIDQLDGSGHFAGKITDDTRDTWVSKGRDACNLLEGNKSIVDTRMKIYQSLIDYQGQGAAEPGLADRAVTIVEAASQHLCPNAPVK